MISYLMPYTTKAKQALLFSQSHIRYSSFIARISKIKVNGYALICKHHIFWGNKPAAPCEQMHLVVGGQRMDGQARACL